MNNLVEVSFRASPAQERMWFLQQMEPESAAYNICALYLIEGFIDSELLKDAYRAVVERHEILRTTFSINEGKLMQNVLPNKCLPLHFEEKTYDEATIRREIEKKVNEAFDLSSNKLHDLSLYKTDNKTYLLLRMHHIISDGLSMSLFINEIATIYSNLKLKKQYTLPILPVQYIDYTSWLENEGKYSIDEVEYWVKKLEGNLPKLNFSQKIKNDISSDAYAVKKTISKQKISMLNEIAKENNATLFMILLSLYKILLYKYTHQEDILVGIPVSNRRLPELQNMIGLFVNTVVIRSKINEELKLDEFLSNVRNTCLEAYENQNVPFEKIVELLQPERESNSSPLIQTMFTLQNNIKDDLELPGNKSKYIDLPEKHAKFDISLVIREKSHVYDVIFNYKKDLFEENFIDQMAEHFLNLVDECIRNFQQKIKEIDILSKSEKNKILYQWNETEENVSNKCIHELFEEQAIKTPNHIALINGVETVTYKELNEESNRLANYLLDKGVMVQDKVGILLSNSREMIPSIISVLKVGATYVPIDPDFPIDRIHYMINNSEIKLIISNSEFEKIISDCDVDKVLLDNERAQILKQKSSNIPITNNNEYLAYILYTSGSTGNPKGVMVPHKGVVNRIEFGNKVYPLSSDDIVLQKTPFTFDVSVWEVFWPLSKGSKLVLTEKDGRKDINYLINIINKHKVTIAHFIPSILNIFLDNKKCSSCQTLKAVFCSGEELTINTKNEFFKKFSNCDLYNFYGPTETSIEVTYTKCNKDDEIVTIGKPISNVKAYVLDSNLKPVPIGVPGELHIGGIAVTKGYLGNERLTREKFIPNPFCYKYPLMYKTGDIVRYNNKGEIIYIGRRDHQVKINGNRVELSEVEKAIRSCHKVKDAVVVDMLSDLGDKILVAYVKVESGFLLTELKKGLKRTLPRYMIPSKFYKVDDFPLNSTGKVDRKALLSSYKNVNALEEGSLKKHDPKVFQPIPRDEIEQKLVYIWEDLLGNNNIGIRDNFFEVGGHSLLLVRMVDRIKREFSIDTPISLIVKNATIEDIAILIRKQKNQTNGYSTDKNLVHIRPEGNSTPIYLFHPIGGTLWPYIDLVRTLDKNIPVHGFEIKNTDKKNLDIPLNETANRYLEQLLEFQETGPYILAGYSYGGNLAFEVSRRLIEMGKDVQLLILFDCYLPNHDKYIKDDYFYIFKYLKRFEQKENVRDILLNENQIRQLNEEDLINYILELSLRTGYLPKDATTQTVKDNFYPWVYNQKAYDNYVPKPCNVRTLFFETEESKGRSIEGWNKINNNIKVILSKGNHYNMLRKPNVESISKEINNYINSSKKV